MEITLDLLFKGKPTVIKDKEFLSTKEYVSSFLKEMAKFTDKFIINVTLPSQITITNKEEDLTFNKVWIQALLPTKDTLQECINLVYALDVKKPCYKIFRTYVVEGRHFVFNKTWLKTGEIKPGEIFKVSAQELMELENPINIIVEKLSKTFLSDDKKYDLLGQLVEKSMMYEYDSISGKVKLSPNNVIKAHEAVYLDTTSKLYKDNQEATVYDFYSALLDQNKDGYRKDILNVFEKSYLAGQLLNLTN